MIDREERQIAFVVQDEAQRSVEEAGVSPGEPLCHTGEKVAAVLEDQLLATLAGSGRLEPVL